MAISLSNYSTFKEVICNNPDHRHLSHKLQLYGIKYKNHTVEITKDGNVYNVRIDGKASLSTLDVDWRTAVEFVENEVQRLNK